MSEQPAASRILVQALADAYRTQAEQWAARLGSERVLRPLLVADHRPEAMCRWQTADQRADAPLPHPFRQPHFLLLNLALGGQRGGPLAQTTFPTRYEVDYVRVYQRQNEAGE